MNLIQLFLPLFDPQNRRFERRKYEALEQTLLGQFGGFTSFPRSPAIGLWEEGTEKTQDELVIYEVMSDRINRVWWAEFRKKLEHQFRQDEILIRAQRVEKL